MRLTEVTGSWGLRYPRLRLRELGLTKVKLILDAGNLSDIRFAFSIERI